MIQELARFDRSSFNALPPIEAADERLRATRRLDDVLGDLQPVFEVHDMCETWALSLLHNHWLLDGWEVPVQTRESFHGRTQYATAPESASRTTQAWPSSLRFTRSGTPLLRPLEFSRDDAAARNANEALERDSAFVRGVRSVLLRHESIDVFGLIVPRVSSASYRLVEFTYANRRSVLRETLPRELDGIGLIQTAWLFKASRAGSQPPQCVSFCTSTSDGGHTADHSSYQDPAARV